MKEASRSRNVHMPQISGGPHGSLPGQFKSAAAAYQGQSLQGSLSMQGQVGASSNSSSNMFNMNYST